MSAWTVIYDDPKRASGRKASHSLHVPNCRDVTLAADRGGNPYTFDTDDLAAALNWARYQGHGDAGDLGDVALAPCVSRPPATTD